MRPLPLPQLFVAELLRRRVDQGEQIRQQLLRAALIVLKNKVSFSRTFTASGMSGCFCP
jgi:hypothetical protein